MVSSTFFCFSRVSLTEASLGETKLSLDPSRWACVRTQYHELTASAAESQRIGTNDFGAARVLFPLNIMLKDGADRSCDLRLVKRVEDYVTVPRCSASSPVQAGVRRPVTEPFDYVRCDYNLRAVEVHRTWPCLLEMMRAQDGPAANTV